jgi:hypothetical protein
MSLPAAGPSVPVRSRLESLNARLVYGSTSLAENEKKHSPVRRRPRLEATELDLELAPLRGQTVLPAELVHVDLVAPGAELLR